MSARDKGENGQPSLLGTSRARGKSSVDDAAPPSGEDARPTPPAWLQGPGNGKDTHPGQAGSRRPDGPLPPVSGPAPERFGGSGSAPDQVEGGTAEEAPRRRSSNKAQAPAGTQASAGSQASAGIHASADNSSSETSKKGESVAPNTRNGKPSPPRGPTNGSSGTNGGAGTPDTPDADEPLFPGLAAFLRGEGLGAPVTGKDAPPQSPPDSPWAGTKPQEVKPQESRRPESKRAPRPTPDDQPPFRQPDSPEEFRGQRPSGPAPETRPTGGGRTSPNEPQRPEPAFGGPKPQAPPSFPPPAPPQFTPPGPQQSGPQQPGVLQPPTGNQKPAFPQPETQPTGRPQPKPSQQGNFPLPETQPTGRADKPLPWNTRDDQVGSRERQGSPRPDQNESRESARPSAPPVNTPFQAPPTERPEWQRQPSPQGPPPPQGFGGPQNPPFQAPQQPQQPQGFTPQGPSFPSPQQGRPPQQEQPPQSFPGVSLPPREPLHRSGRVDDVPRPGPQQEPTGREYDRRPEQQRPEQQRHDQQRPDQQRPERQRPDQRGFEQPRPEHADRQSGPYPGDRQQSGASTLGASGRPTSESLTADVVLRKRGNRPGHGWRRSLYKFSLGYVNLGPSAAELREREQNTRLRTPLIGSHRLAVISLKGGVGKTTTTAGLGATFASVRGDRVIAIDANPDRGTLGEKVPKETNRTVRDLLNARETIHRYSDVRAYTSQAQSRLEVLASDSDPAMSLAFSETDYRNAVDILSSFYSLILTDCGTGLLHDAMRGVLAMADSIVVVSSASLDGARSASATLDWLEAHGYEDLVRRSVAVISAVHTGKGSPVDLDKVAEHFAARCRAVVKVPYDPHLEAGATVDLEELRPGTRDAFRELAALVADDFPSARQWRPSNEWGTPPGHH